jgi:hypothetical protein
MQPRLSFQVPPPRPAKLHNPATRRRKGKMKILLITLAFVVGALEASAQLPEKLGVGSNFPPSKTLVSTYLGAPELGEWSTYTQNWYDATQGSLEQFVQVQLGALADFVAPPGTESSDYYIELSVDTHLGRHTYDIQPVAHELIPSWDGTFRLTQGKDGGWRVPPNLLEVKLSYQTYMPYRVTGLSNVVLVVAYTDGSLTREVSENGVADSTCSLYPGGGAYYGPDILQLHTWAVVPEKRREDITGGSVTLALGDGSSASYDLLTGERAPCVLRMTRDTVPGPRQQLVPGVRLTVSGPVGRNVLIEYAEALGSGWNTLTTLTITTGTATCLETNLVTQRFYRTKFSR